MIYVQVHWKKKKKITAWNRLAMLFGPFVDSFSFLSKFIALQSLIPPTTFSIKSLKNAYTVHKMKFRYVIVWNSIKFVSKKKKEKGYFIIQYQNIYYAHLNCQVLAVIATMTNWRTKTKTKTRNHTTIK
jgi:hypothetical protein